MEKMSTTIYILTVLGALFVPTFAEDVTSNVTANVSMTTTPGSIPLNMTSLMAAYNESDADEEFRKNSTIASTAMPPEKEDTTTDTPVSDATTKKGVHTYGPSTNKPKIVIINRSTQASTVPHEQKSDKSVYFIVLLIVIFGVAVIGIIFFCYRSNSRRFSVDIQAKNEDAHIPLASVEPEEKSVEKPSPTDTMGKAKEKALEADQQVKESPATCQTTEAPSEKLADPTDVDVNDEDPTPSTKTSVETLNDVLNDNNSNNNAVSDVNVCFIEICLNE